MFTRFPYSAMPPFPSDPEVIRSQYQLLTRILADRLMAPDVSHAEHAFLRHALGIQPLIKDPA